MRRDALLIAVLAVLAVGHSQTIGDAGQTPRAATPRSTPTSAASRQNVPAPVRASNTVHPVAPPDGALIQKYCVTCHSERLKTAGLSLQNVDRIKAAVNDYKAKTGGVQAESVAKAH